MSFNIKVCACCNKGLVRTTNADNICFNGVIREESTTNCLLNTVTVNTSNTSVFSVFDGVGSFTSSDKASLMASRVFSKYINSIRPIDNLLYTNYCKVLNNLCVDAHEAIKNEYFKTNINMGTTCAGVLFKRNMLYIFNVGDSKVFQISNGNINKISVDHVSDGSSLDTKPIITQYLGIPIHGMVITPYTAKLKIIPNAKYLICTDGLTDLVSEETIQNILNSNRNIETSLKRLLDTSLENGGNDNVSIILCQVE